MYKCRHFKIYELVDPDTYKQFGQMCWKFFNNRALEALDLSRDVFGPLTVNDWKWGGNFMWSGLRTPDSPVWTNMSAHGRGCAFDVKSKEWSGTAMRTMIRTEKSLGGSSLGVDKVAKIQRIKQLINEIELSTVSWMHIARTNREKFKWIPKPK